MNRRSVTRADVARLAGASTAVVSYVVNDGPRNVAPETRERVLAAIAELGYRPNGVARSLRSASTSTFGMVVPDISNPFFAELANALESRADSLGKSLIFGSTHSSRDTERRYIQSFLDRRVDGIIVIGATDALAISELDEPEINAVLVDRTITGSRLPVISVDHEAAAYAATLHLIEHGHRHIACVAGPRDQPVAVARTKGWARALEEAGLDHGVDSLISTDFSVDGGYAAAAQLTDLPVKVSAVFVSSDAQAYGVLAGAFDLGIKIPSDLAVFASDGTTYGHYARPALSVVQQPIAEIAAATIDLLLTDQGEVQPPEPIEFALVPRASCGCA